eukprot:12422769-Karenia_brevis.AAC.1
MTTTTIDSAKVSNVKKTTIIKTTSTATREVYYASSVIIKDIDLYEVYKVHNVLSEVDAKTCVPHFRITNKTLKVYCLWRSEEETKEKAKESKNIRRTKRKLWKGKDHLILKGEDHDEAVSEHLA